MVQKLGKRSNNNIVGIIPVITRAITLAERPSKTTFIHFNGLWSLSVIIRGYNFLNSV